MKKTMPALKIFADWKPKKKITSKRFIKDKRAQEGHLVWHNPRVEIVEMPIPKIGPTELLIKVRVCGICGSDVLMAWPDDDGYTRYPYIMSSGATIGHEFSGEVVALGRQIKNAFKLGDPVTSQCVIYCGKCKMCKAGKFDDCLLNEELGFSIDGAMAEYVKVDARYAYSLAPIATKFDDQDDLFKACALIEPLAGAYKAIHKVGGGLGKGQNIVVFGGGPIGLSAIAISSAKETTSILVERFPERQKLGLKMGADYVISPDNPELVDAILELTSGLGAKIYFEAAGAAPKVWPIVDELLRKGEPGGTFILFGHGPGKMEVSHETLIGTYAKITGSHGHSGVWDDVIGLITPDSNQGINPARMITKEISLTEAPKWLQILRTNKEEGKVIITF